MIVIATIGLALATYLTILHYARITVPCAAGGNPCEAVQTSIYSHVFGIPVALLGLIGYVFILGSLLAPDHELSRIATLGVTLFGLVFSGYLTYREIFTLKEICEWCVSSAVLMVILFVLATIRYVRGVPLLGGSVSPEAGRSS